MSKRTVNLRQMKADAEAAATSPADVSVERTPVVPRQLTISVTYDAPDGVTYTDDLQSVILDSDGRMTKTRVMNSLTQGMIMTSMPEGEQLRLEALARLVTQLDDAPDWVMNWAGEDLEFLSVINDALVKHENAYFRGNTRKGEGGALKPRISIDCPALDQTGVTAPA